MAKEEKKVWELSGNDLGKYTAIIRYASGTQVSAIAGRIYSIEHELDGRNVETLVRLQVASTETIAIRPDGRLFLFDTLQEAASIWGQNDEAGEVTE
ncbi:hypothetical protein [Gordonia insulae]|uniref:Uncharacterized protein n=1 Tax=Gordonia insulae TaxID=2420509 RepID=A0A3G8JW42_9ACTN|nr:hypothetical protein [Gordonia insulae]AZG48849.1 hypothetical protein D7316_05472 [Gordonia insulae]